MTKIICMIPARLDSKRFPNKLLAPLGAHTLLGNVIEAAKKVSLFEGIYVAGCGEAVASIAKEHGVHSILTDPDTPNGTMRIIEAIDKEGIAGDIFVNWQADEPFIDQAVIKSLLSGAKDVDIWTLKKKIKEQDSSESSIVKVVTDKRGKALYFSRAQIPFKRGITCNYYKHIGLYAFTKEALQQIKQLVKTPLEESEMLEQLRWLENGMKISVMEITKDAHGIDTKEDLLRAQKILSKNV